jgi:hypothetical protein
LIESSFSQQQKLTIVPMLFFPFSPLIPLITFLPFVFLAEIHQSPILQLPFGSKKSTVLRHGHAYDSWRIWAVRVAILRDRTWLLDSTTWFLPTVREDLLATYLYDKLTVRILMAKIKKAICSTYNCRTATAKFYPMGCWTNHRSKPN